MEDFEKIILPWPDWKIVKYLGSGTYGRVYEIERTFSGIQEKAALKIVSRSKNEWEIESYYSDGYTKADIIALYESEIQNYVQEYRLMKEQQEQSNIVTCDDIVVVPHVNGNGIGGDVFIRMELLTALPQLLKERSLSEQEIIKLGKDISHALVLCESKNIIHWDIKPTNIMVSQVGNYPITTIEPNTGISYYLTECPSVKRHCSEKCSPIYGFCKHGQRQIPVKLLDVAGLIPGASEGAGLGNKVTFIPFDKA